MRHLLPLLLMCACRATPQGERALHAVGFRSFWLFDEARTYRTTFDGGATYDGARPLLVLTWFPARAQDEPEMPHADYFGLASAEPRLARLAPALSAYARDVFVQATMGAAEAELDEAQRSALAELLASPSGAHRAAAPESGRFPLVLYRSGAGSSFEDNAALCTDLARHGYVVVAGAFLRGDGSSFGIDVQADSTADMEFLVAHARTWPEVDGARVGLVGHSAGAQAILRHALRAQAVGDALVLLDTTQDYYGLGLPLHEELVREALAARATLTRPLLVAAGPEALFALVDRLDAAPRTYLTVPELGHDEFIAQGLQRLARIERLARAEERAELGRAPQVRANLRVLEAEVLAFLDLHLKGRASPGRAPVQAWSATEPSRIEVPAGVSAPEPYDLASPLAPTPRQFRGLFAEGRVAEACAVLRRFAAAEPRPPILTSTMLSGSFLFELDEAGRRAEAHDYFRTLKELDVPVLGLFEFLADVCVHTGRREQALRFTHLALDFEPDSATFRAKLAELATPADDSGNP
ncbi:MAG: alpha/beta hydrolase [Planctomycetota bacterium]